MTRMIALFGAAVRPGGLPSPALARRIAHARHAALADPGAIVFCSGAVGAAPPSEAAVMARALEHDLGNARLVLDEESRDTLQTARAAADYARRIGIDELLICTDRFHQPRAVMLCRLFGVRARPLAVPGGTRWRPVLREMAAYPYDLVAGGWTAWRHRRGISR